MAKINIYTEKEIEILKEGGEILYTILHKLKDESIDNECLRKKRRFTQGLYVYL